MFLDICANSKFILASLGTALEGLSADIIISLMRYSSFSLRSHCPKPGQILHLTPKTLGIDSV